MGCCIALALVMSAVRRLLPGAHEPGFPPPARRPAPGEQAPAPVVPSAVRPATAARVLVVAGLAWFTVGLVGMHLLGWFAWATAHPLLDVAFHASGLWLAALGSATLLLRSPRPTRAARRELVA